MSLRAGLYVCDGLDCNRCERPPLASHIPPPGWCAGPLLVTFCPRCSTDPTRWPTATIPPAILRRGLGL